MGADVEIRFTWTCPASGCRFREHANVESDLESPAREHWSAMHGPLPGQVTIDELIHGCRHCGLSLAACVNLLDNRLHEPCCPDCEHS